MFEEMERWVAGLGEDTERVLAALTKVRRVLSAPLLAAPPPPAATCPDADVDLCCGQESVREGKNKQKERKG